MPYIPGRNQTEFEKVKLDEWINGVIEDVQEFKNVEQTYKDKENGELKTRKITQVRFKFKLDGYEYSHYSQKMTASMSEKSNLYKFLKQLYGDTIVYDIPVELEEIKGVRVKTMWSETILKNGRIFQFPDKIRSLEDHLPAIWDIEDIENIAPEETPF